MLNPPNSKNALFLLIIVSLFCCIHTPTQCAEIAAIRNAIKDLEATWNVGYPQAKEFLRELDRLEQQMLQKPGPEDATQLHQAVAALRFKALIRSNPLLCRHPLLFIVRQQYRNDHHNTATFFPAAVHEYNNGSFSPGGALKMIKFSQEGEKIITLLESKDAVIRDPEVHFNGKQIIFSMRTNHADSYHLYEISADGTGLRQLTFAKDVDDIDPLYLPDGSIVFSSTREPKYCMCNRHIMANLYRMEADGANIHQIGKSTLFEGHSALMPDGRILYDRWEYVDRNFGDAQSLWTVNPDGTSHSVYWGNNTASPGAVIDGRAIPGTDQVLCIFSSCHDRPWGAMAIIDRNLGLDGRKPVVRIWPPDAEKLIQQDGWQIFDAFTSVNNKYEDPWPLSDKYFLCSRAIGQGEQMGIYLLDTFGNEILVHTEKPGCFDPMPLSPRTKPPVIPTRRNFDSREGYFYVHNVYEGTHMTGVKKGEVKYLRIVESPEKRTWTNPSWNGQGQEAPAMNWHDFNNKRILGTVPVEPDGSAYFKVPAEKFIYFQLLDANGMMVQSMRSGTMAQPGETASCTGCHEDRRAAPPPRRLSGLAALREASTPADWHGPERLFSYRAEVQPVLDRNCVRCHDFGTTAGKTLNLSGDRDLVFNTSYNELWRKKYITAVGAGPSSFQSAKTWGSHASRLMKAIDNPRCGSQLTREDRERLVTWIDLNAPYYPSYASAYPDNHAGRCPLDNKSLERLEKLTGARLRQIADHAQNSGPQVSFDRPELSPCLSQFKNLNDPRYIEALEIIRSGKKALATKPESDAEGFIACTMDQWRETKYQERQKAEIQRREGLRSGAKVYDKE